LDDLFGGAGGVNPAPPCSCSFMSASWFVDGQRNHSDSRVED
jgi:hypothetical protein